MQTGGAARRMALRLLIPSPAGGASSASEAAATPVEICHWTLRLVPDASSGAEYFAPFSSCRPFNDKSLS